MMNYQQKKLKQLVSLCVEKDVTTTNNIAIRYSGKLNGGIFPKEKKFSYLEIDIYRGGDRNRRITYKLYIHLSGETYCHTHEHDYPIDRFINLVKKLN